MKRANKKSIYIFIGLCIPLLYLMSPEWLAISGVGPSWAILWLIPWSIEEGPFPGLLAGLCLGLALDAVTLNGATQIPSLMFFGYSLGRIGLKGPLIEKSFNLGLLAFLGAFLNGFSIWVQNIFLVNNFSVFLLNASIFHTLLAQSIITSLVAPMACSYSLLRFFRKKVY